MRHARRRQRKETTVPATAGPGSPPSLGDGMHPACGECVWQLASGARAVPGKGPSSHPSRPILRDSDSLPSGARGPARLANGRFGPFCPPKTINSLEKPRGFPACGLPPGSRSRPASRPVGPPAALRAFSPKGGRSPGSLPKTPPRAARLLDSPLRLERRLQLAYAGFCFDRSWFWPNCAKTVLLREP